MSPEIPSSAHPIASGIDGPWKLPSGWEWAPLAKCVLRTERADPALTPEDPFTYIDISSINSASGAIVAPKMLSGVEAPSRARKLVRTGDVLFATTCPYLRNVATVPPDLDRAVCSTGFCVLRAKECLRSRWLYWICRGSLVVSQLAPRIRGANYPAVTDRDVLSVLVPVPDIEVQDRVVEQIDGMMTEVEEARALACAMRRDTALLMGAATEEVLGSLGTTQFGPLVSSYKNGIYKPKHYYGRGYPSVRMFNDDLGGLQIPFVEDAKEQSRMVAHLTSIRAEVAEMCCLQERDRECLKQLEQAILDRAFRGEL